MYSSTRIEDTDSKKIDFCPSCQDVFQWHREREFNNQWIASLQAPGCH